MIAVGWKICFQINQKKMETCIYCHSEWNQIRLGGDMCVGMDMVWENGGFVLIWGSWSSGSWSLWIFSSSPTQFGVLLLFFPHPSFPLPGTKHNVWGTNPLSGLLHWSLSTDPIDITTLNWGFLPSLNHGLLSPHVGNLVGSFALASFYWFPSHPPPFPENVDCFPFFYQSINYGSPRLLAPPQALSGLPTTFHLLPSLLHL